MLYVGHAVEGHNRDLPILCFVHRILELLNRTLWFSVKCLWDEERIILLCVIGSGASRSGKLVTTSLQNPHGTVGGLVGWVAKTDWFWDAVLLTLLLNVFNILMKLFFCLLYTSDAADE